MISIIIPAYNSAQSITRAIDSILAQTYCNYEVIVVDDGSTDGTGEVVRQYGHFISYSYQKNSGVCVARNMGAAKAKGEWIAFMDHDDQWAVEKLARQMDIVEKYPELVWCSSNYYYDDGHRRTCACDEKRARAKLKGEGYFKDFFVAMGEGTIRIMPTTMIIRSEIFEQIGGFDPDLRRNEDTDLWCRMGLPYPKIGYVAEPMATRHLNIRVPEEVVQLRIKQRTGEHLRAIFPRYFEQARQLGMQGSYEKFAGVVLRRSLLSCIYHGHRDGARETVRKFPSLFAWHWRLGTYVLTAFPRVTRMILHLGAYIAHLLCIDKGAGRRWIHRAL